MLEPVTICVLAIVVLLILLAIGTPVAVALGLVGFAGMFAVGGAPLALGQLYTLPYQLGASYVFAVVPLFVLMGNFVTLGGLAADLYDSAEKWLRHVRGGLYYATILASTAFGAASGSSVVNTSVFTRIALPEMLRRGYAKQFSSACISSVGTIDAMIPPSVAMVVYAIITEQSLGRLMLAGIVPGLVTAVVYLALVKLYMRWKPHLAPAPGPKVNLLERVASLNGVWVVTLLFLVLMGGIYLGLFSPSSAGAVGAFGAFLVVLVRQRLTRRGFWEALRSTASITGFLFAIIIGGLLLSRMLVSTGAINELVEAVQSLSASPWIVIVLTIVIYSVLGCFLDSMSLMIITLPFLFPLSQAAKIDPIWFGILVIQLVELATITPPVGMNLFATVSAADGLVTLEDVIRGILPFVALNFVMLGILIAFPALALWLPNTMMK
ncbi:MAG TPA: TRAP transporter large permease [Burkholderiales bacterium]|jgi:tripartite ATP-independent transporter DctM subunit|nr:TRAP transporter large permease [Burkholderiales bacterium]